MRTLVKGTEMSEVFEIAGQKVESGESKKLEIPIGTLYTDIEMYLPVFVKRGKKEGPVFFVCAALHGDELNGIEIISRIINSKRIQTLKGTLIAVPLVNAYGVLNQSRYLPDRRDLNRCFPGSKKGSLAGRIAHLLLQEIISKAQFGVDLHTGAIHRTNLPQIRANLDDCITMELAKAFGVPVLLNANLRDGSLRQAADEKGVRVLLYEAGEALRFDELSIRAGFRGVINVMVHLGMLAKRKSKKLPVEPFVARDSTWVRATSSGLVSDKKKIGDFVEKDSVLANIKDPFGQVIDRVNASVSGIIIGKQNIPLVHEGDAMFHIAYFKKPDEVVENLEILQDNLSSTEKG